MAFVSKITLNESVYKSPFSLSYSKDGKVRGLYYPVLEKEKEDKLGLIENSTQNFLTGGGLAILTGDVIYKVGHATLIRGDWKHVIGPREAGQFELLVNANISSAVGFWTDADSDVKHEWKLNARDLGLTGSNYDVDLIMERWGIASAWLFLVQTVISTFVFAAEVETSSSINLPIHYIYTFSYMTFLAYYEYTDAQPSAMYMFGVLLYTVGYGFYADLYQISIIGKNGASSYVSGSVMFLLGSLFLIYALWEFKLSQLLSGSVLFLVGSIAFTLDSLAWYPGSTKQLCILGYVVFIMGRLCFLFGSQTKRCDIFFRNNAKKEANRKASTMGADGLTIQSNSQAA